MKLEIEDSKLITVGDIKEYKTGIDPKNIGFITTLLSSKLYSNPEESFIREIVSNAWDSHVEAGTIDTPVIVKFDDVNKSITIRDYGTGLSKERFEEVYCNIGSSTKRESNDYIGGFGIGKYSSLACSDTVYITSYYEGIQYSYIMVKDGGTITTTLVGELNTEEPNGFEVTLKNIDSFKPYFDGLENIMFFPNVYVDNNQVEWFNEIKIKEYKYFSCINRCIYTFSVLLGNVLYPVDITKCSELNRVHCITRNSGVVLRFSVGELEVTPNREGIVYTNKSIEKLKERALEFEKEFYGLVREKYDKDYTNIMDFYNVSGSTIFVDPMTLEVSLRCTSLNICYIYRSILLMNTKYKGSVVNISDFNLYIDNIFSIITVYPIETNTVNKGIGGLKLISELNDDKTVLVRTNLCRVNKVVKDYLIKKYSNKKVYIVPYKESVDITARSNLKLVDNLVYIRDEIWNLIKDRSVYLDTKTDKEFLKYKKDSKTKTDKKKSSIILHVSDTNYPESLNSAEEAVKWIEGHKIGVIILDMDSYFIHKHNISKLSCLPIGVSVESKRILDSMIIRNRISLDKLYNSRKVRQAITVGDYANESFYSLYTDIHFTKTLNEGIKKTMLELAKIYKLYLDTNIINIKDKYDKQTIDSLKELNRLYTLYKEAKNKVEGLFLYDSKDSLIDYYLMKKKNYRISFETYKKSSSNNLVKFIKELCKE